MHGNPPILFIVAAFIGAWVFAMVFVSHLGGWATLAQQYRWEGEFSGPRWNYQCGQLRWWASYNNCLTVGADPRGLYLWVFPLLRIAHPPLFIPWRDITVSRVKVLWVQQVRFCLGRDLQIPFTVRGSLAQKLQSVAGHSWPEQKPLSSSASG